MSPIEQHFSPAASPNEDMPTVPPEAASESDAVLPIIAQSEAAFYRELPEILKERRGVWVAYHGDERIGFAQSAQELYDRCEQRGLKHGEFVVFFADEAALYDHREIDLPLHV
jgi:hypothetical protein